MPENLRVFGGMYAGENSITDNLDRVYGKEMAAFVFSAIYRSCDPLQRLFKQKSMWIRKGNHGAPLEKSEP